MWLHLLLFNCFDEITINEYIRQDRAREDYTVQPILSFTYKFHINQHNILHKLFFIYIYSSCLCRMLCWLIWNLFVKLNIELVVLYYCAVFSCLILFCLVIYTTILYSTVYLFVSVHDKVEHEKVEHKPSEDIEIYTVKSYVHANTFQSKEIAMVYSIVQYCIALRCVV